jgi:contact-dependent growth inhibition (CDI) system CdiI-like immunity protein
VPDDYPNLRLLLAGYLHLDWTWDYSRPEDAVADFIVSERRETIREAHQELDEVLRTITGDDLETWLDQAPCYYVPGSHGFTAAGWLRRVHEQLARALAGDPHYRPPSPDD